MIIAVCNQKGGVAKTTTSINVASCLAELGKKVLVIDCDPQYNLTSGVDFDTNGKNTIHDMLLNEDMQAEKVIYNTDFEFDIIPADINLANAEVEIANMFLREQLLKDKILDIKDKYDYILIDCNPALGLLTLNSLVACDRVLIPLDAGAFSLEGIGNLQELIMKIKKRLNPEIDILGVLLTRANKNTKLNKLFKEQLTEIFGNKLFNTIIHNNIKIAEAQMESMPINKYDKGCSGYLEYLELTKEILDHE